MTRRAMGRIGGGPPARTVMAAAICLAVCAACGRGPSEVVYAAGKSVHAVNPERGRTLWKAGSPDRATDLSVSADGSLIAVAHRSGLAVFDAAGRSPLASWSLGPVGAVQAAPDGRRSYVLAGEAGRARGLPAARRVYCVRNREKYVAWDAPVDPRADGLALSPDGRRLIAPAASGAEFFALDLPQEDGIPGRALRGGFTAVSLDSSGGALRFRCAGFSQAGAALFLEESGRTVQALRWVDASGRPLARLPLEGRVDSGPAALSADGTILFLGSVSRLLLFDAATGREQGRVELGRTVRDIAVSRRSGKLYLLTATDPGTVLVVDSARRKIVRRFDLEESAAAIAVGPRPRASVKPGA